MLTRKMKDSGVEWIGQIPETWNLKRMKYILKERKLKNDPIITKEILSLSIEKGVFPYSEKTGGGNKAKEDLTAYKVAYPGDIVINSMNILAGAVGLSEYKGAVSPVYYTLYVDNNDIDIRYYYYLFQTEAFQKSLLGLGNGIMMKESSTGKLNTIRMRIPMEKLSSLVMPLPSKEIQKKIINHIEGKVESISKIIFETKQSIEELKKYKQSLITEAVIKGLDKNVDMKDSGVEWIGRTPKHWAILRTKNILNERVEKSITGAEEPLSMSQKFGLIPSKDMDSIPYAPASYIGSKKVSVRDLVFNKLKAHLGVFAVSKYEGIVSPDYAVYQANEICDVKYLEYLFKTPQAISEFIKYSRGIGAGLTRLYTNEFFNIKIALPSVEEQQEIVQYLNSKSTAINNLISEKKKIIEELEQYKKSLIYEYVTGKKEI